MPRTALHVALVITSLVSVTAVPAQQFSFKPDARLRISAPPQQLDAAIARFVQQRGDSLSVYLLKRKESLTFRSDDISLLDVSRGRHAHRWQGAGIGLLVGGLAGGVLGLSSGDDKCAGEFGTLSCFGAMTAQEKGAAAAILGGVLGLAVGAIVGGRRTDKWESVPLTVGGGRGVGAHDGLFASLGWRLLF